MKFPKRYRLSYRVSGLHRWHRAPMSMQLESAISDYQFWNRRVSAETDVDLVASKRNSNGEWVLLDDEEYPIFKKMVKDRWELPVEEGGLPEVNFILRYDEWVSSSYLSKD